ncbi:MAG TPA: hypothetical protein VNO75_04525 [Gemmatimonadaceae bacterium]|nr:hypothetical protein [Gemmatimonadaceae bacterium]
MPKYLATWPLGLATAALLGSTVLMLAGAWRATHFGALPSASPEGASARIGSAHSYRAALPTELERAVNSDPFREDRSRPPVRYEPGGTRVSVSEEIAPAAEQAIVLLGTVVGDEGRSFAMFQTGGAGARLVRVGEKVGDHTLRRVGRQSAVLVSAGGKETTISVSKAGN